MGCNSFLENLQLDQSAVATSCSMVDLHSSESMGEITDV